MKKIFAAALFFFTTTLYALNISGAGASFPFPVYSSWAYLYAKASKIYVNYQPIGSGGGIRQVLSGVVDFGGTDEPLTSAELNNRGLIQFPAVLGGIVPVVNIEGVANNRLVLSGSVLADIFQGNIKKWNDPSILALNPSLKIADIPIQVVYRSDSSGTSAVFTRYLSEVSQDWKDTVGSGKAVSWPVGIGAKGNDGVAGNVQKLSGSIGYVEYAYAGENNIDAVGLINRSGNVVFPSAGSFMQAAEYGGWDKSAGYYTWLTNMEGEGSWPLTAATFILIRKDRIKSIEPVIDFFDWCFENGDELAVELHYVPLPEGLKQNIRGYWDEVAPRGK